MLRRQDCVGWAASGWLLPVQSANLRRCSRRCFFLHVPPRRLPSTPCRPTYTLRRYPKLVYRTQAPKKTRLKWTFPRNKGGFPSVASRCACFVSCAWCVSCAWPRSAECQRQCRWISDPTETLMFRRNGYESKVWYPRYPKIAGIYGCLFTQSYGNNRVWPIPKWERVSREKMPRKTHEVIYHRKFPKSKVINDLILE